VLVQSSELGLPTHSPTPPGVLGGATHACMRGGGGPNSDDWTDTLVLYIYSNPFTQRYQGAKAVKRGNSCLPGREDGGRRGSKAAYPLLCLVLIIFDDLRFGLRGVMLEKYTMSTTVYPHLYI
jgi:hypothetical protein